MHIHLLCVGKLKAGPEAELVAHYLKQVRWKTTLHEIADAPQNMARDARQLREADAMQKLLPAAASLIALDARGKTLSSEAFAAQLGKIQDAGKEVAFAIGGQDGLHESIVKKATLTLAFGSMIWPHKLARAMLCEQIFRAQCIMHNHPYHGGH